MKYFRIFLLIFAGIILLNSCDKEYSYVSNGLKLPSGNWEFKDSGKYYIGEMDTAYISGNTGSKELHLIGTSAVGNEKFSITLYSDNFKPGTYKASLFQATFTYSGSKIIYKANQSTDEFIVTISSLSSKLITGTFSGMALDSSNNSKKIFNGKFKSTFGGASFGPVSVGVLGDSSGKCKSMQVNGVYKQGVTSTAANTVQVQVTVASIGDYSITTNSVNGIIFSGTGNFSKTGVQNILLTASGVPAFPGDQSFIVKYGNSQCAFTVNFLPGAAASNDYYPLTINNTWTYGDVNGTVSDSFTLKVISNSKIIGGNTYSDLATYDVPPSGAYDSTYIRKANGNYFSYMDFSNYFFFDQTTYAETIILKDNVPVGSTWVSPTVSGTISGVPVSGSFKFTILEKGVPAILGIFSFPDVIKVKMESIVAGTTIGFIEFWYAKNVGLVYALRDGVYATQIGRWLTL
ncbi:MAG: hypothetical protein ABIP35_03975 [Ginsengibacter sp.]